MKKNHQGYSGQPGYQAPQEYPNMQGYQAPQGYPAAQGYPPVQSYSAQQGYPAQTGYQAPMGYQAPQGYQAQQGYQSAPGFQARNYQTPQVTGSQPAVNPAQDPASYSNQSIQQQNLYQQQGYVQTQPAYPGGSYTQQPNYTGAQAYPFPGSQNQGESYIPQTPYTQGYSAPGYQAPSGYNQGYNAYNQMGRSQQYPLNPSQEGNGQVPLNGGGYVPQPVPIRKGPFVLSDLNLLIISGVLLAIFALGMILPGLGIVRWLFLGLAAATIAILWIKPMTAKNKRLCYTIVFGLLALIMAINIVKGTSRNDGGQNNVGPDQTETVSAVNPDEDNGLAQPGDQTTPAVTSTPEPEPDNSVVTRAETFFYYWSANRQDDMLTLCSPTWMSKEENPKTALFGLMANRTPKEYNAENVSGTENDTSRTVTMIALMDRNNGKDPVKYRMSVIMVKEADNLWYVDPKSLKSYESAETTDPNITSTPAPTETPAIDANTTLYYNPSGGEYYHYDQNCKRINERYLPLQGHFKFSQLNEAPYDKLKPCAICGAPSRDQ